MITDFFISIKRKGGFAFIPDKLYYNLTYLLHCHGWIDWRNPRTFAEKLNWLKLYDRRPLYHTLVDKCEVRKYVEDKIGKDVLIKQYGTYNSFEEIDFDKLPDKFVLKCTHDSGSVKIVEKRRMDLKELAAHFHERIKTDFFHYSGREWPYKGLKPRIIAEEFIETPNDIPLTSYKFHCFNGEPRFIMVEQGLLGNNSLRLGFYDLSFKELPFKRPNRKSLSTYVVMPSNFHQMIEISKELSKDSPFIRVDLYSIKGRIYFSELTLYPVAGYVWYEPVEWNEKIGNLLDVSSINSSFV